MDHRFFERPIINSPYAYPRRRWELDSQGQPTQQIIEKRRRAEFITPIPSGVRQGSSTKMWVSCFSDTCLYDSHHPIPLLPPP
jgi:type III restriction enzyme